MYKLEPHGNSNSLFQHVIPLAIPTNRSVAAGEYLESLRPIFHHLPPSYKLIGSFTLSSRFTLITYLISSGLNLDVFHRHVRFFRKA